MSNRITNAQLENLVKRINEAKGYATEAYTRTEGRSKANINTYYIEGAYGGVKLVQIVTEGGGIRSISNSYGTKRHLYDFMQAYLAGIWEGKPSTKI
jgi:hypothetical protein